MQCKLTEKLSLLVLTNNEVGEQRMTPFQQTKSKIFCVQAPAGKVLLMLFWGHRGPQQSSALPRGPQSAINVTFLRTVRDQSWDQNVMGCSVLVFCCSTKMQGYILPMWQLRWHTKFILSVSLVLYTCPALLLVTNLSLGHWRMLFEETLSDPVKKCKRQCMWAMHADKEIHASVKYWRTVTEPCWKMTKLLSALN